MKTYHAYVIIGLQILNLPVETDLPPEIAAWAQPAKCVFAIIFFFAALADMEAPKRRPRKPTAPQRINLKPGTPRTRL
jgi:hypothetical protein